MDEQVTYIPLHKKTEFELVDEIVKLNAENAVLRVRVAELENTVSIAHRLIDDATDLMTPEQVGQWRGVRTWLETLEP